MLIDTETIVSVTDASRNFSKVASLAEKHGRVVIMRNNQPRYLLVDFEAEARSQERSRRVEAISEALIANNADVYEELSK